MKDPETEEIPVADPAPEPEIQSRPARRRGPRVKLDARKTLDPPPGEHPSVIVGPSRRYGIEWKRRGRPIKSPGRPVKYANRYDLVRDAARVGNTFGQIGFILGFTPSKWQRLSETDPKLTQAFEEGKSRGINKISKIAFNKAQKGDNFCIQLYLRCIGGWKETSRLEVDDSRDQSGKPNKFDVMEGRRVAEAFLQATEAVVVVEEKPKPIEVRQLTEEGVRPQELLSPDVAVKKDGLTRPGPDEGVGVIIPPHEEN